MPLIATQHLLTSFGSGGNCTNDAIEALKAKMEALPPVKIVSLNTKYGELEYPDSTMTVVTLLAVVEEV